MTVLERLLGTAAVIRPSALPGWNDCARRAAAQLFPVLLKSLGFDLRHLDHGIGASVGSAVHRSAKYTLDAKLETGESGFQQEAMDHAMERFKEDLGEGITWDQTTPSQNTAEEQIRRMTIAYRDLVAPKIDPVKVEERLEASVGDGLIISGQKDVLCREPNAGIRDLKTGKMRRVNAAQYGAYALIDRSHGREINTLTEDWIPRATLKKPQPDPEEFTYPVAEAEHMANETVRDIRESLREFSKRLDTGEAPPEAAFRANPLSMLCSPKYCRAHGTNFCRLGKPEKGP